MQHDCSFLKFYAHSYALLKWFCHWETYIWSLWCFAANFTFFTNLSYWSFKIIICLHWVSIDLSWSDNICINCWGFRVILLFRVLFSVINKVTFKLAHAATFSVLTWVDLLGWQHVKILSLLTELAHKRWLSNCFWNQK